MARIPKRLHGPAQVSNSAATKYTTPAVTKTIVRHIHVSNPTVSAATITLSIGADAAPLRIFDAYSLPANSVHDHWCYYVMEAGEVIQALSGTNNALVLVIDGDENVLG
jgi:hypothetical protein